MIMTFGVSRPGEIVTSDGYEPDNESPEWQVSDLCGKHWH